MEKTGKTNLGDGNKELVFEYDNSHTRYERPVIPLLTGTVVIHYVM